jgi:hypothetical protein
MEEQYRQVRFQNCTECSYYDYCVYVPFCRPLHLSLFLWPLEAGKISEMEEQYRQVRLLHSTSFIAMQLLWLWVLWACTFIGVC